MQYFLATALQGKVADVPIFSSKDQRLGLGLCLRSAAIGGRPHNTSALDRHLFPVYYLLLTSCQLTFVIFLRCYLFTSIYNYDNFVQTSISASGRIET